MALDLSKQKLLVIDDFPEMRSMVRKIAAAFRASDIDDAKNGAEAIKMMEKKKYDIILCDYNLGEGKDGQQILEEAKHRELINYASIFMMITAENTMEMVMGAMEYHPDGYLTKPFNKAEFASRLEKIQERKADLADIEKAISRKDNLTAINLCNEKLAATPKNALELMRVKADLCEKMGEFVEAAAIYEKVLSLRDVPWAALGLARVRFHTKDYMVAKEMLQDLIEKNSQLVEAYDWLAKTYEALGDLTQSQRILSDAVAISPKAILRQKALADVALRNNDLDTAEGAFKRVIRIGKASCFKTPADYSGLSKVYLEKKAPNDALKVISNVRDEFNNAAEATLQAAVMEGRIYTTMGQTGLAEKAVEEASHIYSNLAGNVPTDVAMDLAKTCFSLGKKDQGEELVKYVVRNHHEDEAVLRQAEALFTELGMGDEGRALISSTRQEVIDINNKGVQLAKEGKLEESIEFFTKAAGGMPENQTINLNAAQSLIMHMQRNGKNDRYLYQTRQYLDRVRELDPTNDKYQKLLAYYKKILGN
jgi:CheY-like chemotaxis protein